VREEAGKAATATEEWVRDKVGLRTAEEVQAMDLGDREIYLLRTEVLPAGLLPPPANTVVVGIQNVRWADESMQHIQQSVDDAGP